MKKEYTDNFISTVSVTNVGSWVDVTDTKGNTYSLTQFGVKGMRNLKKGMRAALHMQRHEHFTFLYLTP